MSTRRAWEIGLAVGLALGLFVRGSDVQAPSVQEIRPAPDARAAHTGLDYRGAVLQHVRFQGNLTGADFSGSTLRAVDFSLSGLDGARFDRATVDRFCRWPTGFDPTLHGATLNDWPRPQE